VVKVSGAEGRCVDRNHNGTIETSRDLNDDGVFQLEEVLDREQDECILFATNPGGKIIRAIGVDGENHCWAGSWSSAELYRLHPDDGQVLRTVKLPKPAFGLVIDGEGVIWCSTLGTTLLRVAGAYVFSVASPSNYGISLDNRGRVWIGGSLSRFDPVSYQWTSTGLNALGVAGSTDGFVYGATGSTLYRVNMDTMAAEVVDTQGLGANGVALDSDGYVWTVNNGSSNVSKVNPGTKEVLGLYPVSPGGETFSDLTGYTLNNFTAPSGFLEFTLGGATETPVKWKQLRFGAAFPEGTWVEVLVRAADTIQALPEAKWQGPVGPYSDVVWPLSLKDIPNLEGRFLQVRLGLHSQHRPTTPTVWSVEPDCER
jgi:hypothetical protein